MNAKQVSVTAYHDLSIKCCNRKHKFHELEFAGFFSPAVNMAHSMNYL